MSTSSLIFSFLQLGDPTVFGNLEPCPALAIAPTAGTSYTNALGTDAARAAIAAYHSIDGMKYTADQVVIASGCSGTLDIVLTALLDPDTILLVPQPGFPLYEVIAQSHGAQVQHYRLLPPSANNSEWQVDLAHVAALKQRYGCQVRAMVVNNPSNPTGGVFSESHLRDLVQVCDNLRLPIVADEIYGNMVFEKHTFHPLAQVAAQLGHRVPVVTCSGLAKQFLLPGWRIGWAIFHDNQFGSLQPVHAAAKRLANIILGASHLAQSVIPVLLDRTNESITVWKENLRGTLERQAALLATLLDQTPGLHVFPSAGAMYFMVQIDRTVMEDAVHDDQTFCAALLREEHVFCLPGACFGFPGAFRVVFSAPVAVLQEAACRLRSFCVRHAKKDSVDIVEQ